MKLIKVLTSWTLIFALATLQIQGTTIVFNSTFAEAEPPAEPTPVATAAPSLDYRSEHNDSPNLTINQIMVLFVLLTGPTVGIGCFAQVSGKIFAASAAIYLVMEIMNYSEFKDASTSNQEMYATLDNETEDAQIEAFTFAEQQELTAANALATKKKNTQILAIGISAAAIASFVEAIYAYATYGTCVVSTVGSGTCGCAKASAVLEGCAISPCTSAPTCTPGDLAACAASTASNSINPIKNDIFSAKTAIASVSNDAETIKKYQDLERFMNGDSTQDKMSEGDIKNNLKDIFKIAMDLLLSKAQASDKPAAGGIFSGLGISAAIITIFLTAAALENTKLLARLGSGVVRGTYFTILAAFAWAAVSEIGKGEDKLKSNAKVYGTLRDRLMQALNSKSRFAGINGPQNAFKNRLAAYGAIRDEMNNLPDGAICLTGNAGEKRVDENCQCRKTNTCAKVDFSGVDFKGQGVPSFFGSTLGGLQTGANSLFAGNFAGANSAFGTLGNNAANIRKLNKDMKEQMSKRIKNVDGLKNLNLDSLEKAGTKDAELMAKKTLSKFTSKNAGTLASIGIGSTGVTNTPKITDANNIEAKSLLASIEEAAKTPPPAVDPLANFKFDFGDEEEKAADTKQVALSQGDALGDFVTNESDISNRPDESIFKIITVRYFKSAYPRIFEEDKKQNLE